MLVKMLNFLPMVMTGLLLVEIASVFAGRKAGVSVDESDVVSAGGKNCVYASGYAGLNWCKCCSFC